MYDLDHSPTIELLCPLCEKTIEVPQKTGTVDQQLATIRTMRAHYRDYHAQEEIASTLFKEGQAKW